MRRCIEVFTCWMFCSFNQFKCRNVRIQSRIQIIMHEWKVYFQLFSGNCEIRMKATWFCNYKIPIIIHTTKKINHLWMIKWNVQKKFNFHLISHYLYLYLIPKSISLTLSNHPSEGTFFLSSFLQFQLLSQHFSLFSNGITLKHQIGVFNALENIFFNVQLSCDVQITFLNSTLASRTSPIKNETCIGRVG